MGAPLLASFARSGDFDFKPTQSERAALQRRVSEEEERSFSSGVLVREGHDFSRVN